MITAVYGGDEAAILRRTNAGIRVDLSKNYLRRSNFVLIHKYWKSSDFLFDKLLRTSIEKCIGGWFRENLRAAKKEFAKTEDDLKSLQSVGQIIGEVLRPLENERLIIKASSGPRYVAGCRSKVDREKLTAGTRVVLDMTTLTTMRALQREVDPVVYNMLHEDPGNVSYSVVGGLSDQIRELRESIELPLMNPELFLQVGIKPPKGVLLYGPPGTGKTLLARAIASNIDANFLKVVSSAIIDKYIGESARLIREMFNFARDHQPCIIFMDEIDAIGGHRFSEGTSADREIQRTLMELLNQLDGFDELGKVKIIMATNRPDVLDPALLRPGRLDRKIEIPLPNEQSRMEILKIHAASIAKHGEIDYEAVVKLAEDSMGPTCVMCVLRPACLPSVLNVTM
ncbi:26S protease regulatory subunit S10B [Rhynchospora pubera]|uniref:26S protease regulatory subunit S10B n=1 Tax=Rhynchospora pubera TaxID=906938 RepID=A0AAV8EA93_9POAL|nr:26S protease regulatory subunit S10B [Rhynchospora pubera]